jgi:hypothetical protein
VPLGRVGLDLSTPRNPKPKMAWPPLSRILDATPGAESSWRQIGTECRPYFRMPDRTSLVLLVVRAFECAAGLALQLRACAAGPDRQTVPGPPPVPDLKPEQRGSAGQTDPAGAAARVAQDAHRPAPPSPASPDGRTDAAQPADGGAAAEEGSQPASRAAASGCDPPRGAACDEKGRQTPRVADVAAAMEARWLRGW